MRFSGVLGIVFAVLLHALFLLFGGLIFPKKDEHKTVQAVDLFSDEEEKKEEEQEEPPPEEEKIEADEEEPPDAAELLRSLEPTSVDPVPELEAASLGALEQALSGQGSKEFTDSLSLASGGRIGGMGKAALDEKIDQAFSLTEIDQQPRAIFQGAALYPAEMRKKKLDGVVAVIFVVDSAGKVATPRVASSSHPGFEKAALDAVKQWKFEPALRAGKRVSCKMRVSVRFQPGQG